MDGCRSPPVIDARDSVFPRGDGDEEGAALARLAHRSAASGAALAAGVAELAEQSRQNATHSATAAAERAGVLIAGPLGSLMGLYETAIDHLCTWALDGKPVRPKVVASTATVRRAEEQAFQVFWRRLEVFPQDCQRAFAMGARMARG